MRSIVITKPGGPEVLELRTFPDPEIPFAHVRVRVRFAGVNRADVLQRRGGYPAPPGVPADIPGLEYAGVVDKLGDGVDAGLSVGDRVFGLVAGGAYADTIVVHAREVVPIPVALSDRDAAAVPETFVTAYDALFTQAALAPGERVLVHAAGSGVGTAAIQLAARTGARVVGTSRTPDKLGRASALGMHAGVVVGDDVRFADAVRDAFDGAGADVVLDLVGGNYVPESIRACAPRARVMLVGLTAGRTAELDLGLMLRSRVTLRGTVLRSRPLEEKIALAAVLRRHLGPLFADGSLRAQVDRVFPLGEAAEAHRYLESNASFGKVVLAIENT